MEDSTQIIVVETAGEGMSEKVQMNQGREKLSDCELYYKFKIWKNVINLLFL